MTTPEAPFDPDAERDDPTIHAIAILELRHRGLNPEKYPPIGKEEYEEMMEKLRDELDKLTDES